MTGQPTDQERKAAMRLQTPPSEIEVAELVDATRPAPDIAMVARRLALERFRLREQVRKLMAFIQRVADGPRGIDDDFDGDIGFVVHVKAEARALLDAMKGNGG